MSYMTGKQQEEEQEGERQEEEQQGQQQGQQQQQRAEIPSKSDLGVYQSGPLLSDEFPLGRCTLQPDCSADSRPSVSRCPKLLKRPTICYESAGSVRTVNFKTSRISRVFLLALPVEAREEVRTVPAVWCAVTRYAPSVRVGGCAAGLPLPGTCPRAGWVSMLILAWLRKQWSHSDPQPRASSRTHCRWQG